MAPRRPGHLFSAKACLCLADLEGFARERGAPLGAALLGEQHSQSSICSGDKRPRWGHLAQLGHFPSVI